MKQLLKWLGLIVMASQIFSINIPILSSTVMGYSVKFMLYYSFYFGTLFLWWLKKIKRRIVTIKDLGIMVLLIGTYPVSLIWGWSVGDIFVESILILMPVIVYQWVDLVEIDRRQFANFYGSIVIVAGVVSVLIAFRLLDAGIWAAENDYVRSASAVESTIGVGGVALALTQLYIYPEKYSKKYRLFLFLTLASGIVSIIFAQSRTKLVMVVLMVVCVFLYNVANKKSKHGSLRLLLVLGASLLIVCITSPQVVSNVIEQIARRFTNEAGAMNVTARVSEASLQLECFIKSPVFGMGWGSRSQFTNMFCHNLYTAVLMQGGLFFGGIYIVWFASYLIQAVTRVINKNNLQSAMISLIFMLSLVILGFTNGGISMSGGYTMMAFVFIDEKKRKENRSSRIS